MDLNQRVVQVSRKLLRRGVKPLKLNKGTELSDPAIWITESIYIQIGIDYIVIFNCKLTGLSTYNCKPYIDDIMNKLRLAINENNY